MSDRVLRGIGVSPGLAYAPAVVLEWRFPDVPDRSVDPHEVDREIAKLHEAVRAVADHLNMLREKVLHTAGLEESRIFEAQSLLVQDPDFIGSVEHLIRQNNLSAETAYEFKALELRVAWSNTANMRVRERLADLSATQIRVLRELTGHPNTEAQLIESHDQVVIVARELSPGITVQFDRDRLAGLVSEEGTRTSHAAILAHSLGIPAVMGASGAVDRIVAGTEVLVDGYSGTVVIAPTRDELERARTLATRRHKFELELEGAVREPSETPDGHAIALLGNVDLPEEIEIAVRHGAEGVGLLRTEFLVTGRAKVPGEPEQYEYFRRVSAAFPGRPVVIRTFDLGGDKFPSAFDPPAEANPFLGWRSIRVCLDQPEIFRPQLRAILRVAVDRQIRMMLPLVTRVDEVLRAKELIAEEAHDLAKAGVRCAPDVPVGVMVETPAAVVIAERLAKVSAFFSVGTNDLTQYTLAVDRGSALLASRFTPHDPAVLLQLQRVVRVGREARIDVSVCGEMASDPLNVLLLVGLGYRSLSVSPPALPVVKWLVRNVPLSVCEKAAADALEAESADLVPAILREHAKPHVDLKLVDGESALPGRFSGARLQLGH